MTDYETALEILKNQEGYCYRLEGNTDYHHCLVFNKYRFGYLAIKDEDLRAHPFHTINRYMDWSHEVDKLKRKGLIMNQSAELTPLEKYDLVLKQKDYFVRIKTNNEGRYETRFKLKIGAVYCHDSFDTLKDAINYLYNTISFGLVTKPSSLSTVTFNNGTNIKLMNSDVDPFAPAIIQIPTSCSHKWKSYRGFTENYDYCELCQEKKG